MAYLIKIETVEYRDWNLMNRCMIFEKKKGLFSNFPHPKDQTLHVVPWEVYAKTLAMFFSHYQQNETYFHFLAHEWRNWVLVLATPKARKNKSKALWGKKSRA